ncbi:MAG: signal peptidase I [Clostridia bacterium]
MKIVKKILSSLIIIILLIIVLISGIVFINSKKNPNEIPSIFGYKPFVVLSGSMETEIYKGDLVIVKKVEAKDLKENDIIAFRDDDNYVVTHRIVEKIEENGEIKFKTKGDNNNIDDDGYVNLNQIEGIYEFKISGLGNVVMFMQRPSTLIITLILIFVGGAAFIAIDDNKLSADERKELEEYRKQKAEK